MPLALLLDENLRHEALWHALQQWREAMAKSLELDIVRVGDVDGPPVSIRDDKLVEWAVDHRRILISQDESTLSRELIAFCDAGRQSPGVIYLAQGLVISDIVDLLILISQASEAAEWANTYRWVP
jgi:hypothetical protein